ncbi:MAG TPA: DUF1592 domain-containing protein [Polyangia bacterium]|nr:DUF1592 domain-containing protein [Polyangia bacterium]
MIPGSTLPPNMPPVIGDNGKPIVPEPNRVTMRRLNQNEYDNTVRDLLGTTSTPARVFLNDTQTHGFDNNGDLLGLTPTRLDQYFKAAETLADEALKAPLRAKILSCDPAMGDACIRTFVTSFGERAFRRPVTDEEVTDYLALAAKARTAMAMPEEVVHTVLQALLMSPHFLFRVEIDADPTSLVPHPVGQFELASRLSYLVYGSMPDDVLYAAAKAGQLTDLAQLKTQLGRMLTDSKARFSQSFSEQWLDFRDIDNSQPDVKLFPTFNPALAASMKAEVTAFFDDFIKNNRSAEELLTARFSYLDDKLAKHYGLTGGTATLARTDLTTDQRGGILGMGALMTATSRGNRTSPVDRGRWVLASLLCSEPPPPPPDLVVPTEDKILAAATARDFLAEHRKNPSCAACHSLLDPIGLSLENYDAVGAWRTLDRGTPIQAAGILQDGTPISGPRDLAQVVSKDARFRACLVDYLLTYATGRTTVMTDKPYIEFITKGTAGGTAGLKDLLTSVVTSDPFRLRRGDTATGGQP